MNSAKGCREIPLKPTPNSDQLLLSAAISNSEDLGPFVRKAFASGETDTLLHHLRQFSQSKEYEIKELCKAHYQDFVLAVDDLRPLHSDADELKAAVLSSDLTLQSVATPLLTSLDSFLEAKNICQNVSLAIRSVKLIIRLIDLCSSANRHLRDSNFYMALRKVDLIEQEYVVLDKVPSSMVRRMLEARIPMIRSDIERQVIKQFGDWLVQIRTVSRDLGQLAIGQASAARQREELRIKQWQAEEQSDLVYTLEEEDDNVIIGAGEEGRVGYQIDFIPLYRAYHIHQTLGLENQFKQHYFENRKLQLTSDLQVSSMTPFLESHQTYFAQIAGFFIVEERILRTSGKLISRMEVESLWDTAVRKMCSVLEDQFSRIQTANHLLLIKDHASLLRVTMRKYGHPVDALLDVLSKHRDKYHELLLSDCRKRISEALSADKFQQMLMTKKYQYTMNVLAFHIQTSDITPAFPYVAPFSSTVPDCCRIVRSFIQDSVSFMSYCGQIDIYNVVKKYLDRLLVEALDGALLKAIDKSIHGVSQAMQMAANMAVFERACEFFFKHAAQLSGVPSRVAERSKRQFPLSKSRDAAQDMLSRLLKKKVDKFMTLIENVDWMADVSPQNGNEYVNEVIIYLEALVSTAQQILPLHVLKRVMQDVLCHISETIVRALASKPVKRFNINAIMGIDIDVKLLESFAQNQEGDGEQLKNALAEARKSCNSLLSNHPENFLNPVIKKRSYSASDYRKVVKFENKKSF